MPDHPLSLPDDHDEGPVDDGFASPTPWFVAEAVAFAVALLGSGWLLQLVMG